MPEDGINARKVFLSKKSKDKICQNVKFIMSYMSNDRVIRIRIVGKRVIWESIISFSTNVQAILNYYAHENRILESSRHSQAL